VDSFRYKPARDIDLSPTQRRLSVRREVGTVGVVVQRGVWAGVRVYLKAYHRWSIEGADRLPQCPPFVLVANHTSHLDALMLAAALPASARRSVYPIAAGDVFFHNVPVSILATGLINALPMWRHGSAVRHALGDLRARLTDEPCGFILFPEGRRGRDHLMQEFKAGLGMLVAGQKVPVVPCRLTGALEALPPGRTIPRPRTLRLQVGPALMFDALENSRTGWETVATETRAAIEKLASPV